MIEVTPKKGGAFIRHLMFVRTPLAAGMSACDDIRLKQDVPNRSLYCTNCPMHHICPGIMTMFKDKGTLESDEKWRKQNGTIQFGVKD